MSLIKVLGSSVIRCYLCGSPTTRVSGWGLQRSRFAKKGERLAGRTSELKSLFILLLTMRIKFKFFGTRVLSTPWKPYHFPQVFASDFYVFCHYWMLPPLAVSEWFLCKLRPLPGFWSAVSCEEGIGGRSCNWKNVRGDNWRETGVW